ncbi:enoyl-CoA hydratase/isomerase family protein [Jannaschia sp. W003]|uniref:enoyl-CoA hydratase/isomerase family protein n=1 Tax=Jannaschia sp. W003 TaxID=2867012 RepID=UPI0021A56AEF|nr:enoyl-CoA hydratase/isomerase family protein [Jannaschia sp. W003]UWQ20713.1 enoyl-CoA hydratase/isomerase family protein [Jannaschia sp. W003]
MSDEIHVRVEGRAGRITLDRPKALNALTHAMCLAIEQALDAWRDDDAVAAVVIDGAGDRAFCAGGDITAMHAAGLRGEWRYGQDFWRDEYRMNRKLFHFPKPVVAFLHGFTMGGGVGVGCHASHRVVNDTSRIAMPECGIGLVPDVGGSLWLARAPGRLGEFLGVTGYRMGPGDAIHAGFADFNAPGDWEALKARLCETGDPSVVDAASAAPPEAPLAAWQAEIDRLFAGETLGDIARGLAGEEGPAATHAREAMARNAPLSMACAVEIIHRLGDDPTIERALAQEFRFTYRALEHGDFVEGIRAQVIDKDRDPKWRHDGPEAVARAEVVRMLMPLGADGLNWEDEA